jgi:hypothetical protein
VGCHNLTAQYLGDSNSTVSTSSNFSQVVNPDSTATNITSSVNPSVFGQPVGITVTVAAVAPGSGTPSGQVNVLDGTTTVGTCVLASASCTITSAALTVGSHNLTAQYLANGNSTVSTSLSLAQVVNAAGFSLSASAAQAVNAGSPASFTLTVSPNPSPHDFAVTDFVCGSLPTATACSFSATSVTPGSSSGTITLTVSTTSRTVAMLPQQGGASRALLAAGWGMGLIGAMVIAAAPTQRKRTKLGFSFATLLLLVAFAVGCAGGSNAGGGNPPPQSGTPAGTYNIVVTATGNGGASHTATAVLTVN